MADDTCLPSADDASERIAELEDMVRRLNVRLAAAEGVLRALLDTQPSGWIPSSPTPPGLRVVE